MFRVWFFVLFWFIKFCCCCFFVCLLFLLLFTCLLVYFVLFCFMGDATGMRETMGGPGGEQNQGAWCEPPKVSIKKFKREKKEKKISPSGWPLAKSVAVSLSMVDVRASSPLRAMLSLDWGSCEAEESTLRKKSIEYKPGSSISLLSLLKFLPPGSSPGFLLLVLFL